MKRKIAIFLLAATLLCILPRSAKAAAMDSKAGAVTTASGYLNVRSAPSSSSAIVSTLPKGSYITLLSRDASWWRVEYAAGRYGYCHKDYITIVQGTPVKVNAPSGLNVRSGGGTAYPRQAVLPNGSTVLRLTTKGGWSRILYHGTKTGHVSDAFLSGGHSAVSLSVPSYKQTDSRWGNVLIGTSGKTMAQIGCATTAIAMTESLRLGYNIYPDAMAKQLRYTPSGSVYWPSHYTVNTSSSGYLDNIHSLLAQGKSVLFGAKTASGKQHWVVITGFTGGSLTADRFTIHDPGSNSRTNLQQFLNAYPVFYKYFHY